MVTPEQQPARPESTATATAQTETTQADARGYAAFKIEQHGIDLIPDAERRMKPAALFWLWAAGVKRKRPAERATGCGGGAAVGRRNVSAVR